MKILPPSAIAFLQSQQQFYIVDLYQFNLVSGTAAYFTSGDTNIGFGSNTYVANSLIIEGMKIKLQVGVRVDEQDLKISVHPQDTLAGAIFLAGISQGLLDGATILRTRLFYDQPASALVTNGQSASVELFYGHISTITKAGRTKVELKVKSPLALLDLSIPRNYWSPTCLWTLYDAGCGLAQSAFSTTVTINADVGSTQVGINGGVPNPNGPDGFQTYALGRAQFTSGVNNGLVIGIKTNDDNNILFAVPLKLLPSPGDTMLISQGCSKFQNTCSAKFNNLVNFRAFPFVPPVTSSI